MTSHSYLVVCSIEREGACNRLKRPISRVCLIGWMSCADLNTLVNFTRRLKGAQQHLEGAPARRSPSALVVR
jgi:hypothetical protein